jgi:small conductance mechanosensitive channel
METHRMNRCMLRPLVPFLIALALFAGAPPVAAQVDVPVHPAWERVESLRAELAELPALDIAATDEDAMATLARRLRREQALREQLGVLVDAAATADVDQPRLVAELERQASVIREEIDALDARIDAVRGERQDATPEALLDHEYRLRDLHGSLSGLLEALLANTARMARLDVDTTRHAAALDELLKARAARLSARLELAIDRLDSTRARRKAASADQQGAIEMQLTALEERRNRLKDSLAATVDLMDRRELETRELEELMFRASGKLSGDLLDGDILFGLLGGWLDDARAALVESAPGWLFKLIVFVLIVVLARWAANQAGRVVRRAVSAPHLAFSQLLRDFFVRLAGGVVLGLGLLVALSQVGI